MKILFFRKIAFLVMIIFLCSILTGCYDQREIDDLAYPLAMGLDVGEADVLRMSLQLAAPLKIGGGGGDGGDGGNQGESSSVISIDTPSIYSGLNLINNVVSKEINMSHVKLLVISKKLAESGILKYIRAIYRGREFRPDIFVVVSNGHADEYLKNVRPILESNPAKYYDLLLGKDYSLYYPTVQINDFYNKIVSDYAEPVAVFSDIGKYESTDELPKPKDSTHTNLLEFEASLGAGEIPIIAKKENEVMGMAIFKNAKMVGIASGVDASAYKMITGDYNYSFWTIADPQAEGLYVMMNVTKRGKPDIKVNIEDDESVAIKVFLDYEGDIVSIQSGLAYEENPSIIEEATKQVVKANIVKFLKKTTDEYDSDICGFGRYVKGKFTTWDSWKSFNWPGKYKNTTFDIEINFKIRRTGLMVRSTAQ